MRKFFNYFHPIRRLGNQEYSLVFALVANLALIIFSEIYCYRITKDPLAVGQYIIFFNVIFVVYFAFRDGIKGGVVSVIGGISYYFYIVVTRHYTGRTLDSGLYTTTYLGIIYLFLAYVIGWLRQIIDTLIEKEAEGRRRLETIIQQLPVGILITDSEGKIIQTNKQLEIMLGKKMPKELQAGKDQVMDTRRIGEKINLTDSVVYQSLKTDKTITGREFIIKQGNHKNIYVQVDATPIHNKQKKIIAAVSIISDITAKKEMDQRKDDFINMASHELKTPLTSIKVFSQVLQKRLEKKDDKEAAHLVTRINTQLNKLTVLVGDLLDVTRMEKGKLKMVREKFYIKELAEEIIEELDSISNHNLQLKWTTRLPVWGDKERIRQVLTNLITNAIKYAPDTTDIIVGSQKKDNFLEIYVQDFGVGITKVEQKKIFDRFYQVAEHSTYPGLGLGLYISSLIVKQHRGKLWVESEKAKGATFYFSLPVYQK